MKNRKIIGAIIAAGLTVGSVAFAEEKEEGSPRAQEQQSSDLKAEQTPSTQVSPPVPGEVKEAAEAQSFDKTEFIKEVAKDGMMEVNLGQIATQKGQDPQVKELGQRLVTDHSKAIEQLKELAQKKGITLATEIEPKQQKMIDHLSGLSGAEFDKAFAMHAVKDHKKCIAHFQKAATSDDSDISQFATATLPTLKEHLKMAQMIAPDATVETKIDEAAGADKSYKSQDLPAEQKDDSTTSSPDQSTAQPANP